MKYIVSFMAKGQVFAFLMIVLLGCESSNVTEQNASNEDNNPNPSVNIKTPTLHYPPESNFTAISTNTSIAKPAYLGFVVDPEFNSTVIRITNRETQTANAHLYPKTQSYNSNSTLLRLGYRIYHADTFKETNITTEKLIDGQLTEMKWSTKNPKIFYGLNKATEFHRFQKATIDADNIDYETLVSFPKSTYEELLLGKYEGNIDYHDRYVVFAARKVGESYLTAIVYNIENNTTITTKDFPDINWTDEAGAQVLDWVSVSPLGNYVLINWKDDPDNTDSTRRASIYQYDLHLNYIRKLSNQGQHGDIGVNESDEEVYVQFEFGTENGIWSYKLEDANRTRLLPDKYNGGHVSCRNYKRKGWCYLSTTSEGYREVFALKLDGSGTVNRFAQTHAVGFNSQGGVNPDGTKVLFFSNWGVDGDTIDTYQAQYNNKED